MATFSPREEYTIENKPQPIKDFHSYKDEYITRPPYQRKSVWPSRKKQALLDSLFRKYYIPRLVIREVRLSADKVVREIVDGQQRIITVQEFFDDKIKLPETLNDIKTGLGGKYHWQLDSEIRRFIEKELQYDADIIKGIDDPRDPEHQKIATEIFWRLQQGEPLNFMEKAHARLASLVRNFVVKYADDLTFDFDKYEAVDRNSKKHPFFKIYSSSNDRLQHLLLLTRLLMLESHDGPTELKDSAVEKFINDSIVSDGIGNESYENQHTAKKVLATLNTFYEIFKDDPMIDETNGIKELSRDYVVISLFLLIRHLKNNYVFDEAEKVLFKSFFFDEFYPRWKSPSTEDTDIYMFSNSRQMDQANIEERDRILRQVFLEYIDQKSSKLVIKDKKRAFDEEQKIKIYRQDKGLCQQCLREGKSEKEATVSWREYEADHILPHKAGGKTEVVNAQVLCSHHNRAKSGLVSST